MGEQMLNWLGGIKSWHTEFPRSRATAQSVASSHTGKIFRNASYLRGC